MGIKKENKFEERVSELERQLEIVKAYYLGHSKGGGSREITNRYNEMKSTLSVVTDVKKDNPDFIEGYKFAISVFERRKI